MVESKQRQRLARWQAVPLALPRGVEMFSKSLQLALGARPRWQREGWQSTRERGHAKHEQEREFLSAWQALDS